jgi:hypothetical protein
LDFWLENKPSGNLGPNCVYCISDAINCFRPKNQRPPLYIVNLQWTPKDSAATLKLNGRCDDVMKKVMVSSRYYRTSFGTSSREKSNFFISFFVVDAFITPFQHTNNAYALSHFVHNSTAMYVSLKTL